MIWKWTDVPELLLPNVYSAWTDLGLIACASPEVQCLHDPRMTLSDSWVKQMGAMFNSLPDAICLSRLWWCLRMVNSKTCFTLARLAEVADAL